MNRYVLLLIAICLLASGFESRRHKEELAEQVEPEKQKETVLESNHFQSNTETKASYDINDLQKDKPLLFILKPHKADSTDKLLEENPITITLKQGSNSKSCVFSSYTNLCVLSKVTSEKGTLEVQCKKTPCQLSWDVIQPGIKQQDGNHGLEHLVSVNKDKNHAAVEVLCDSLSIPDEFSENLVMYTNSKYRKQARQEHAQFVWFLFDNEQEGYYYITSNNQQIRQCANVSINHMNDEIQFNNPKDIFKDFLEQGKTNNYEFTKMPTHDFRIQADLYDINEAQLNNETSLTVSVVGFKNKEKVLVSTVDMMANNDRSTLEFNIVFKKPAEKFDSMEMELTAKGQILIIQARFVDADVQEVNLGELSQFALKKGQIIKYRIIPLDKNIQGIQKYHIFPQGNIKISEETCPTATGCEFTVEAIETGQGNIYIGDSGVKNMSEIIVEGFESRISARLHPGEQRYYSHKIQDGHALQLLVNVPNAIVFAASKSACPVPDPQKCHEISFNHHFPAIYQPKENGDLIFLVRGLDSVQFTLTVLDEKTPFVELKDSQPFTYLFDDREDSLVFEFIISKKEDVSFNLIGPTNQLNLYVLNEKRPAQSDKIDWTGAQLSSDGFIKINKDDIKGLEFAIKVEKRSQFAKKFAHFTVIASTKESNLHLSTGSPHYQTLKVKDTRDYVFEFLPKAKFFLNFYTHNIKHGVKLNLKLSNADEYNNIDNTAQFIVDKYVDTLDLDLPASKLCRQNQGTNCQLYLRVQNMMEVEVDVTITLMVEEATVQLKDGIWQSYAVNEAVVGSHFYFLPKHPNHSATIFYQPSSVDLKIFYTVWTADDLSVDIAEWPFPQTFKEHEKRLQFKPLQYIHIEPDKLKSCWPNCVILMSLLVDQDAFEGAVGRNESALEAHFRIMATNNYIEIPIKHKVDILLSKDQTKELLVDLKYYLQKQQLNFYTHHTIGNAKLKANVYSESNPRCPTLDDDADFVIDDTETTLSVEEIKKKLEENSMEKDKNIYLCILASADKSSKFNIEFNTNSQGYRKLKIDTTTTIKGAGKTSLYYLDNSQQIYLKISRNQGFPFCDTKLCKPDEDLAECFDQFAQKKLQGQQIAEKVTTFAEQPCPKCILLVKITAHEETQLVLHAQSKYNQIELSANSVLSDSLAAHEQNKYTLTGTKYEQIIINVQVLTGNIRVAVHDFEKVDITKANQKGSKNIHITIPPKDLTPEQKALGTSHMSSFGLSSFVHLHIVVESQDADKAAAYSITYSVGAPVVYLQDGLITQYSLISKKETKFIFKNPVMTPIYLYTSTTDVESLKNLEIKYYVMNNEEDQDAAQQITPQKSDFQKKTVNPTHFALLPAKQNYFFTITNQNSHNTIFTIGVNNRQIIYLPFDHEFPIELGPKQHIYLVLNPLLEGFVKLTFNKCSLSRPFLGYTTDYDDFIKEQYQMQDQMGEELSDQVVLKVKKEEGLYIKVQSQEHQPTLVSVKAAFSANKIKVQKPQPGNQGILKYQLLASNKAEISFDTLVCEDEKNCKKDYAYTALSSSSMQNVYSQLVCPSIMFNVASFSHKLATSIPITATPSGNKIIFTQELSSDIEYVGVRAVNSKTGDMVYYQPVEIVTFWGQVHRSSSTTMILAILLTMIFGCGCLIIYRRYRRNQYVPLGNEFADSIDR